MAIKPYSQYLEAEDIAEIDAELALNRSDTCVIQRKSAGFDPAGAPVSGGFTTVASIGCQVKAAGRMAVERVFGGQFGPEADYVIEVDRADEVYSDDQIIKGGKTFEVVSTDADKSYGFQLLIGAKAT